MFLKLAGIAVAIVAIAAAAFIMLRPSYTPLTADGSHIKGSGGLEVVEFSDFQCPACGLAYGEAKQFVDANSGKVKFMYKHFPLKQIHPYAFRAAEASECAADMGKFWEYHDRLFENQQSLERASLVNYAEQLGLDRALFEACLDSGAMKARVEADISDARARGVSATPTFFIEGRKFEGVLTAGQLEAALG